MKESIERIISLKKSLKINSTESLFLFATNENIDGIDISADEVLNLVSRGLFKSGKLTEEALLIINNDDKVKPLEVVGPTNNPQLPKLNPTSAAIVKRLATHFIAKGIPMKEIDKLNSYSSNKLSLPFMYLFLEMFPTKDKSKNKAWEKHFGSEWDNVTLRRITNGTARKFASIWKTKDIGLFLLGTYIFIKSSFNEKSGKYFVKNIENYLAEYQHWYEEASDMLEKGELEQFTKQYKVKSENNNTTVL